METLTSAELLGENGPLAKHLSHYTPRQEQQALSTAIETVIAKNQILIAEAGTGTGKTFAYLIPALMSEKKLMISTGTKNLQDQLFHRDLPFLRKILALPIKIALLKGRSNYLCKYRIENTPKSKGFLSKEVQSHIEKVRACAPRTGFGEISEITDVAEDSPVWPYVTSNADNCLGQECTFFSECYLMKARRKAMEADVVIVNHHLFFADLGLKQKEVGELLPKTQVFILDEAHQLPEIASHFFGERITSRQIIELTRDTEVELHLHAKDMDIILKAIERLKHALNEMRHCLGETGLRYPWAKVCHQPALQNKKQQVVDEFAFFKDCLEKAKERSKGLESCWLRAEELEAAFLKLSSQTPVNQIHWLETFAHNFSIHFTPMSIADEFRAYINLETQSWIFTSATLAIACQFDHYVEQMGLQNAQCLQFDSPFNYQQQALLYVPRGLPDPNDSGYTHAMITAILPVIKASKGRTFILFTSFKALKIAQGLMTDQIAYPLLVQGQEPKHRLLEQYKALGNAVLLATGSFWEGIDVRGEALSCVIIDKLPFKVPDDPIHKARALKIKEKGKNPFYEQQLPDAAITLKQGAGRLIRDSHDKGVLVLCDPRIISRDYGLLFLKSIPPMPRTREITNVELFFKRLEESPPS